jgi:tRNA pseudouridine38-40 synthase
MVTRIFIELQYNGRAFHGWQRQPEARSVQSDLEEALSTLLRVPISVMGCGRTDAGVHASYFVAHADIPTAATEGEAEDFYARLTWKLNGLLCAEIAILGCGPVAANAHARFDAHTRRYTYWMHNRKDPMIEGLSARIFGDLDVPAIQAAAQKLVFRGDFAAFCKSGGAQMTTICDVRDTSFQQVETHRFKFDITADRFLRNMIRAVVGTLLEIGTGRRPVEWIDEVLASGDRSEAGRSAPAEGLYLSDVRYPDSVWKRGGGGVPGGVKP